MISLKDLNLRRNRLEVLPDGKITITYFLLFLFFISCYLKWCCEEAKLFKLLLIFTFFSHTSRKVYPSCKKLYVICEVITIGVCFVNYLTVIATKNWINVFSLNWKIYYFWFIKKKIKLMLNLEMQEKKLVLNRYPVLIEVCKTSWPVLINKVIILWYFSWGHPCVKLLQLLPWSPHHLLDFILDSVLKHRWKVVFALVTNQGCQKVLK